MKKHTFKDWMIAVRPWSFPASVMPVLVTLAFLFWHNVDLNWGFGIWAILNIVLFHASGNAWSDYFDFKKNVDADDTFGAKTLTSGMFEAQEIRNLALGILAVAVAGGIALLCLTGLPLLWIGLAGLACTVLYPFLKFMALGDIVILLAYAFLPAIGTSYVAAGEIFWNVLWITVPVGFITVAILHCNNMRDIDTDRRADIHTFAMSIGGKASVWIYVFEVLFPFAWVIGCILGGIFPWWTMIVYVALFPAVGNVNMVLRYFKEGPSAIANLDEMTAKLQLLFGLLFTVSLFIA